MFEPLQGYTGCVVACIVSTKDDYVTGEPKTTTRIKEDYVGRESNRFGVPRVPEKKERCPKLKT